MIFKQALFYKLAEIAIESFFESVIKNFHMVNMDGGTVVRFNDLKEGDKYRKICCRRYGYSVFYHDVEIGVLNHVGYEPIAVRNYSFAYREMEGEFEGSTSNYLSSYIVDGSLDDFSHLFDRSEEYYGDWFSIKESTFNKLRPHIMPHIIRDEECIYEDDSDTTIIVWC